MEGKVGAGGEIRRLHIIYFLSRTGRVEQPHLIRVHHLNRNGVHLRDVKRWLSDLRGKDMPDSFAWSYKRRYKKGFVWQDLLDDDLITPISDNEFVLKGSEIAPTGLDYCLSSDKKGSTINQKQLRDSKKETQTSMEVSLETSGSFGSERSTVTEVSMNDEEEKLVHKHSKQSNDEEQSDTKSDNSSSSSSSSSSLYSILLKKDENNENDIATSSPIATSTSFLPPPVEKGNKRCSNGGNRASLFRNLLSCGAVDTNDSVLVVRNKNHNPQDHNGEMVCKSDKLGGSARVFGTHWNQNQHHHQDQNSRKSYDGGVNSTKKHNETTRQKPVSAAYKPVRGPTCSQCGKSFKPEKLHKHMKSCRGMRAMARKAGAGAATSAEKKAPINKSTHNESAFSYMLTN